MFSPEDRYPSTIFGFNLSIQVCKNVPQYHCLESDV